MALTATIEWVGKNGSTIKPLQTGCLFEGTARNHTDFVGVFSVCGGIVSTREVLSLIIPFRILDKSSN